MIDAPFLSPQVQNGSNSELGRGTLKELGATLRRADEKKLSAEKGKKERRSSASKVKRGYKWLAKRLGVSW